MRRLWLGSALALLVTSSAGAGEVTDSEALSACQRFVESGGYAVVSKKVGVHSAGEPRVLAFLAMTDGNERPYDAFCEVGSQHPVQLLSVMYWPGDCDCIAWTPAPEDLRDFNANLATQGAAER